MCVNIQKSVPFIFPTKKKNTLFCIINICTSTQQSLHVKKLQNDFFFTTHNMTYVRLQPCIPKKVQDHLSTSQHIPQSDWALRVGGHQVRSKKTPCANMAYIYAVRALRITSVLKQF